MSDSGRVLGDIVCRGCWAIGNNCRTCSRCIATAAAEIDRLRGVADDAIKALVAREMELDDLRVRIRTRAPHPSHVFCRGPLVWCVHCEIGTDNQLAVLACANTNAGKAAACCECGSDYPRSELIDGHVLCAKCRASREPD